MDLNFNAPNPKKHIRFIYIAFSIIIIIVGYFSRIGVQKYDNINHIIKLQKKFVPTGEKAKKFVIHFVPHLIYNNLVLLVTLIILNVDNIYKTFVVFNMFTICQIISGILQFYFGGIRPFNEDERIVNHNCNLALGYSFTDPMIFSTTAFYLSIYFIFFAKKSMVFYKKILWIIPFLAIIFFICFYKFVEGNVYMQDIVFSVLFGFAMSFLVIFGFNLQLDEPNEFLKIIHFRFLYYIIIFLVLLIIFIIPFFTRKSFKEDLEATKLGCYKIENNNTIYLFKFENKYKQLRFSNLCLIKYICDLLISVICIKLEYRILFKNNQMNFVGYNFDNSKDNNNLDDSLSNRESIIIVNESKWNKTSILRALSRLLILIVIGVIGMLPKYLITSWSNFALVILVRYIFSSGVIVSMLFFIIKAVLSNTNIINRAFFVTS